MALIEQERALTGGGARTGGRRSVLRSARKTTGRGRRPAFGLGLTAAAAVAAATLVLVQAVQPPVPQATRPSAREVLLAAAVSAGQQPADGDWWGIKLIRGVRLREPGDRYTLQVTAAEQTWIQAARRESHWTVEQYLGARPATPPDEQAWRADGSPTVWTYRDGGVGRALLLGADHERLTAAPGEARSDERADTNWRLMLAGDPPAELTTLEELLPTDPERLRTLLQPSRGTPTDLMNNLADLIVHVPVSSRTRAAAYQLMASLPGVTGEGETTDQLGRTGQAITYLRPDTEHPRRQERTRLIVDPATGAPLALEELTPDTGEIVEFSAVESITWTDQKPELPNPHRLTDDTQ
uniref:CU044_5270 family protein n=1 Tax=Nonomuraea bangladeshensis TaxID=404385 RepID=UPI003F497B39